MVNKLNQYSYLSGNIQSTIALHLSRLVGLMKPKIIVLLAITGFVGFLIPSYGSFEWWHPVVYLITGSATAGGAMAINNVVDKDIDGDMVRTAGRASVGEDRYSDTLILAFGGTQILTGVMISFLLFGIYTAFHLFWGAFFYLGAYTLVLKRNSVLNTILGGLASPAPVLGAFAARAELGGIDDGLVLGVTPIGWLIAGLVFFWTPTHTWAMAVKNFDDYQQVDIPMLPVIVGIPMTATITLFGGIALILYACVMLGFVSTLSLLLSFPLHLLFFRSLWQFYREPTKETGTSNFYHHNVWLGLVYLLLLL